MLIEEANKISIMLKSGKTIITDRSESNKRFTVECAELIGKWLKGKKGKNVVIFQAKNSTIFIRISEIEAIEIS